MIDETVFNVCNGLALIAWIGLIVFPASRFVRVSLISGGLILLFAITYLGLIIAQLPRAEGDFMSLDGVATLSQSRGMVVAGWLHYLAFDLFVGVWITLDARSRQFKHWWVVPALILTFMLGPAGLLTYYLLRSALLKNWWMGLYAPDR
jgi:hypothetical protein